MLTRPNSARIIHVLSLRLMKINLFRKLSEIFLKKCRKLLGKIMTTIKFSPTQKKVVESIEGSMAVIAAAGSGKTRVLTGRIAYLLQNIPGSYRIMALTFTNKAAEEMKSRLSSISSINERVYIGTIHSFCLNILREKRHIIGLTEMPHIFEKETDRIEVVAEVFKRNELLADYYNKKEEKDQKKLLYDALEYISRRKRNLQFHIAEIQEELLLLYDDYNAILSEQNAIDYDDIILLAYRIFTERSKVAEIYRKLYSYICVDEAQDLNFAQYEFIKTLCSSTHKNVLMVGDDKQAIFGFNGSDKKYFSELFVKEYQARIIFLTENYRSSKIVIRIANSIFPDSIDESKAFFDGHAELYQADNEGNEADYVIKKIKYYINELKNSDEIEGPITLDNICVIARNKYLFKPLEDKLKTLQIPYYYKRGSDTILFESDKLRLFELGIRVTLNPRDRLHLRQMLGILKQDAVENGSLSFEFVKKLITKEDPIYKSIIASWKKIEADNKSFRDALDIIQNAVQQSSIQPEEKLMIYNEVDAAKEYWRKYCSSVPSDSISIQGFLSNVALGMVNVVNAKEKGLTLGTVHSVKGLEYDIVFVIGLNEGSFPDYRAVRAGGKAIEEEKNETNVAITRAKRFIHLSYPKNKLMPWDKETLYQQKISRFLKNIDKVINVFTH
jgi:DNA helicase-2/ATP-dependent DNA helicase PcrA